MEELRERSCSQRLYCSAVIVFFNFRPRHEPSIGRYAISQPSWWTRLNISRRLTYTRTWGEDHLRLGPRLTRVNDVCHCSSVCMSRSRWPNVRTCECKREKDAILLSPYWPTRKFLDERNFSSLFFSPPSLFDRISLEFDKNDTRRKDRTFRFLLKDL